jgi:hypothetical protein
MRCTAALRNNFQARTAEQHGLSTHEFASYEETHVQSPVCVVCVSCLCADVPWGLVIKSQLNRWAGIRFSVQVVRKKVHRACVVYISHGSVAVVCMSC